MICLGFGTNDRLRSRIIRWATKSRWSHCWVEYPSGIWGGRWAAHSTPDGVVKVPVEQVEKDYPKHKRYEVRVPVYDLAPGFTWAREHIGASYDYGVIWNMILLLLYRSTGWERLYNIVIRNAARFSCSEFASGFLRSSGVVADTVDIDLVYPGELDTLCSESPVCVVPDD